jgi:transposase
MEVVMGITGRHSKLTAGVQEIFVETIARGGTQKAAAAMAGVGRETLRIWMQRGRAGEEPYASFEEAIRVADARAQDRRVRIIDEASEEDWRAAAWWLERRHPEDWGRQDRVELTVYLEDEARRYAAELGLTEEDAMRAVERVEQWALEALR